MGAISRGGRRCRVALFAGAAGRWYIDRMAEADHDRGDAQGDLELFRDPMFEEEDAEAEASASARISRRPRRIVAISGAKGGVGKSLLTANLGIYLATIGRKVVMVDADPHGANVHTFLGMSPSRHLGEYTPPVPLLGGRHEPPPTIDIDTSDLFGPSPADGSTETDAERSRSSPPRSAGELAPALDTPIPGLKLVRIEPGAIRAAELRSSEQWDGADVDYVVVDLGSGSREELIDFWIDADLSLFVSLPEPTAIENTYRFVRSTFRRMLDREVAELGELPPLPAQKPGQPPLPPLDLARELDQKDNPVLVPAQRIMRDFKFRMVLNQTRLRADLELGDRMRSAMRRRFGLGLEYLGYIDYDDTVWTCVRAHRPLLVESPGTKASKSIEKIARRLLAIDAGKSRVDTRIVPVDSYHDLLEVSRGATDEEVRRAYKRCKEIYAPDSLCRYGLFDQRGLEALRNLLDEAYDVLLDPERRRPYELSVFPNEPEVERDKDTEHELSEPPQPAPVITPDTEFTGRLLAAVRESQGVHIKEVSQHTKIGASYLSAIEAEEFALLPALVYVRGFVTEMAKYLRLDSEQVSRTFVRRYQRYLDGRTSGDALSR